MLSYYKNEHLRRIMSSVLLRHSKSVLSNKHNDMEFKSLIFLLMLVYYYSTFLSKEIIAAESSRLWHNPFDRLFNATKFRKSESQEIQDLEFYHPDDLKLLHTVKNQKIIPQQQLNNEPYPITKFVEELFPGFKLTTLRPALRNPTNSPAPTKGKISQPIRKSGKSNIGFILISSIVIKSYF